MRRAWLKFIAPCVLTLVVSAAARAQTPGAAAPQPPAAAASVEAPKDPLGRSTPRGTVLGFINAGRRGDNTLARQYLDTHLSDKAAEELAHQLFVVLDARLPAVLTEISDNPEGSRADPLRPDLELIGAVKTANGPVEIWLERVKRGKNDPIWLFDHSTLDTMKAVYEEIGEGSGLLARALRRARIGNLRLEWVAVIVAIILLYIAVTLLNRLLNPLLRPLRRRLLAGSKRAERTLLPVPVRLLIVALIVHWGVSWLPLPLLMRQFWSSAATVVTIACAVALLIIVNGEVEGHIARRMSRANAPAAASLLRVSRRVADIVFLFVGLLAMLAHFDIDPTPAMAGLGVGGIALALAAQKTLENVIAGASLIFDQAVRVGDFLKMGETVGTVDHIGLRSTRIRTLDRTVVSIPNGQIANASLETISARDKFWFHPIVRLTYDTTPKQLHAVVDGISRMLQEHPLTDKASIRVRFVQLGAFSFDIEVFAYLFTNDWNHFLEVQEQLLFGITETVERAGAGIALPAQGMYVGGGPTAPANARMLPTA